METSNSIRTAEQQDGDLVARPKPDAAKLIAAKRSSPRRFKELVEYYRKLGASDADIVAAAK